MKRTRKQVLHVTCIYYILYIVRIFFYSFTKYGIDPGSITYAVTEGGRVSHSNDTQHGEGEGDRRW